MAKKKTILIIGIIVGVGILVGLGPIFLARRMNKVVEIRKSKGEIFVTSRADAPSLILQVSGKITMEKIGMITLPVLISDSGQRYILIGPKTGKLGYEEGNRVKVVGKIKYPFPKEIKGEPVRFTVDVSAFEREKEKE